MAEKTTKYLNPEFFNPSIMNFTSSILWGYPSNLGRTFQLNPELNLIAKGSKETSLPIAEIKLLTKVLKPLNIKINDIDNVVRYINSHPDIVEPLIDICQEVRRKLNKNTEITLGYYIDYEDGESYLVLNIKEEGNNDFKQKLKELDNFASECLMNADGWIILFPVFLPKKSEK